MHLFGKPYACFIFDFDGVILDTEKYHFLAWRDVFEKHGITLTTEDYLPLKSTGRPHIIKTVCEKYALALTDGQKASLAEEKGKRYTLYASSISRKDLVGGVESFLKKLKSAGCKTFVATSSLAAGQYLSAFSLKGYFDAIYDGSLPLKKKPAPDLFLHIAKEQGIPAGRCVVFEDSSAGILAAQSAGMDVVAIGGIQATGAVRCADDFSALLSELG